MNRKNHQPTVTMPDTWSMRPLVNGYKAASDLTGLPINTLKKLVARRIIRIRKPLRGHVYFDQVELDEDLRATTQETIF